MPYHLPVKRLSHHHLHRLHIGASLRGKKEPGLGVRQAWVQIQFCHFQCATLGDIQPLWAGASSRVKGKIIIITLFLKGVKMAQIITIITTVAANIYMLMMCQTRNACFFSSHNSSARQELLLSPSYARANEAGSGYVTSLRSHSWWVAELGLEPRQAG